jgi:hypothetical protein
VPEDDDFATELRGDYSPEETVLSAERLADAGAVTTGVLTLAAWLAQIEIYLRLGATVVAIAAGACAALYHYEAWRQKRRERDS